LKINLNFPLKIDLISPLKLEINALKSLKKLNTLSSNQFVSQNPPTNRHYHVKPSKFNLERKEPKKNIYDVIGNFFLVKKFISILQMGVLRKPKFLGETHYNLIGDISSIFDFFEPNSPGKTSNISSCIYRLFLKIKPFHPFSKFILFWDIIHLLIFFCVFIIVPINLSFQINVFENELHFSKIVKDFLRIFVTMFYILDIFLNFNLSYYDNGELICVSKTIIKRYLQKIFFFDLISFIFLFLWIYECSQILIFCYFIKFIKIRKIVKNFEELLVTDENYFHIYSLFMLFVRVFTVAHLAACVWHYIGMSQINEPNWLFDKDLVNKPWLTRYLYSFYFVIISMNTVGFGDIVPKNPVEILFCIFFVVVGCMMFAYCLNCMGTIFHAFYKKERELKEELFLINDFMKCKNIPQNFQMKIRKYLKHNWISQKQLNLDLSKKVFDKLSQSLKSELLSEAYGSIVHKIDLFSMNFSQWTLNEIIKTIKEESYPPGETIFTPEEYKNCDMFFIKKGNVEIFVENELNEKSNKIVIKQLKEGNIFGEIAFFSDMKRNAGARSKEYTTLIRFNQNEFKKLIEENNEDKEKYNDIKDRIKLYGNYDYLFIKCYSCNQRNHLVDSCPLVHRKVIKDIVLARNNYSEDQKRSFFARSLKKHRIFCENNKLKTIILIKKIMTLNYIKDINDINPEERLDSETVLDSSEIAILNENSWKKNNKTESSENIIVSKYFLEENSELNLNKLQEKKQSEGNFGSLMLIKNKKEELVKIKNESNEGILKKNIK